MSSVSFGLIELDEVDSTNAEAMRRAAGGERGPIWLIAARQTKGRGRAGRAWQDGAGNLMATHLVAPGCPPSVLYQLSLLAGVAVHDALTVVAGARRAGLRLKWPNDILLDGDKLGGILVESTVFDGQPVAAIGIGINIAAAPKVQGRRAACLAAVIADGAVPTPRALLVAVSTGLTHWLDVWENGRRFDAVRSAWLDRAGPIGEAITVHSGTIVLAGTFAGLAPDGALLVRDREGHIETVTAGDVGLGEESK